MKFRLLLMLCAVVALQVCLTASNTDSTNSVGGNSEVDGLTRVAKKWVELHDEGRLPGMTKDEHGKLSGYHLTESVKKDFFDSKIIDKNMLSDIKGCKDSYLAYVETTEKRHLKYFFCVERDSVGLVSAYSYDGDRWSKIDERQ
jgi:hypothetical protein